MLLPITTAYSHPRGLGPRRHTEAQHLAQRPDVIRQSSGHGRCPCLPALGGARAIGGQGLRPRLAQTGMREAKVVVRVIQRQLLVSALFAFAQRRHSSPYRRHMLAEAEVESFNERSIDLPAARR